MAQLQEQPRSGFSLDCNSIYVAFLHCRASVLSPSFCRNAKRQLKCGVAQGGSQSSHIDVVQGCALLPAASPVGVGWLRTLTASLQQCKGWSLSHGPSNYALKATAGVDAFSSSGAFTGVALARR